MRQRPWKWQRHSSLLCPVIVIGSDITTLSLCPKCSTKCVVDEQSWLVSSVHKHLIQPGKVRKLNFSHWEALTVASYCRLLLFHQHTCWHEHTHAKWCVWNVKSLFLGNPSDICVSHYHNNWASTTQCKSLVDLDTIITREDWKGNTAKHHNKAHI